jgi:putative flippase GtrA
MKIKVFSNNFYIKYKEKILYLIFGFLTVVINLISYKLLRISGVGYKSSTNVAFVVAVLFAFFTNKHIVFKQGNNYKREIVLFFAVRIFTQVLNYVGLVIMVEQIHINDFTSQVFLNIIVIILNYIFSKYAIFINK